MDNDPVGMASLLSLSLLELQERIGETVRDGFPNTVLLVAETSEVRISAHGHCYLDLVQKDDRTHHIVASAKAIIWQRTFKSLHAHFVQETGMTLAPGMNLLMEVKVDFKPIYGMQLCVEQIYGSYTLGELARNRRIILQQLEEEGIRYDNQTLPWPVPAQRIAVISSAKAAGYGDFIRHIEEHRGHLRLSTHLFQATMQGDQVEAEVLAALHQIAHRIEEWDAVVIIRGGGATSDFHGFETYNLVATCAQFPLPIITGIGHERDQTLIDEVAHKRCKTPTAVAAFLIQQLNDCADRLAQQQKRITDVARTLQQQQNQYLAQLSLRINTYFHHLLRTQHEHLALLRNALYNALNLQIKQQRHDLERHLATYHYSLLSLLQAQRTRLDIVAVNVEKLSPERILQMGYSMTLYQGKVVRSAETLTLEDKIQIRFAQGTAQAIVKDIEPTDKSLKK